MRQVINAIRPIEPTRLFVACDGPNPNRLGEVDKVAATRAVIEEEIDWPCHIERLYSDVNQGCRLGVSSAISWFFQHVNEGIILEDDCIPHPDFFSYCSILLNRYRHDTRIWCISGSNFQDGQWRGDGSYYFSRYNHCWGWASWRRSWQHYDADLSQWTRLYDGGFLRTIFDDSVERHHWKQIWQCLLEKGRPDSWAYRWTFTCLINGALTALPNRNLVENVGFGEDATHTKGSAINTGITEGVDPNLHPTFILRDSAADRYTYDHHFGGKWQRFPLSLLRFPRRVARFIFRKTREALS